MALAGAAAGLLGFAAAGGFAAATGTIAVFGMTLNVLQCMAIGASIGSLFGASSMDAYSASTPNYAFGPLSNTKSQLLPIPIVYGRCKMAGNIFLQRFYDDDKQLMDEFIGVSEGEVSRIYDVYADDYNLSDPFSGASVTYQQRVQEEYEYIDDRGENGDGLVHTGYRHVWQAVSKAEYELIADSDDKRIIGADGSKIEIELKDCYVHVHLGGAAQAADPLTLGGRTYPNTAYVALHLKAQENLSGNPTIVSMVDGIKVKTSTSGSNRIFSRNPAWIIYDFLTNERYGVGLPEKSLDMDAFETAALYCDALVDGEPRYTLDYAIDSQKPAIDHLQDMLACFGGYIVCDEKIRLLIEGPEVVSKEITGDNIVKGSFQWWQKSSDDTYNRVTVQWTDPDQGYEQVTSVYQDEADIALRGIVEQSYTLKGITRKTQADRRGTDLLRQSMNNVDLCSFNLGLKDSDVEIGDVLRVKFSRYQGWENRLVRVVSLSEDDAGIIQVSCIQYSGEIYTSRVIDGGRADGSYPARVLADISALTLSAAGRIESDGTWIPGIAAAWQLPNAWAAINVAVSYKVADATGDSPVFSGNWQELSLLHGDALSCEIIAGVRTGYWVNVRVQGVKADGSRSAGAEGLVLAAKDTAGPAAPTSLSATGWFGSIILEWLNPTDADFDHCELWECEADNRAAAVLVGKSASSGYTRYVGSFVGRYYWVRGVDHSGNYGPWNANAGTYGYSDQGSHDDLMKRLLKENAYLQEALDDLQTGLLDKVEELAETILLNDTTLSNHTDELKDTIAVAKEELWNSFTNGLNAEAGYRLQLAARVNSNLSAIQQEFIARAGADSALASSVSTLISRVGEHTTAIQTNASSIDGVKGQYSVTIDSNGYVSGWKLIGGPTSGSMIFNVDNFMVGKPGASNKFPFVIGTVDNQQVVSMDKVFIQDASIKTLKVADRAISNFVSNERTEGLGLNTSWQELNLIAVQCVAGYPINLIWSCTCYTEAPSDANGTAYYRIRYGYTSNPQDILVGETTLLAANSTRYTNIIGSVCSTFCVTPNQSGTIYFAIDGRHNNNGGSVYRRNVLATNTYR